MKKADNEKPTYKLPKTGKIAIIPYGRQGKLAIIPFGRISEMDSGDEIKVEEFCFSVMKLRQKQDASFELEAAHNAQKTAHNSGNSVPPDTSFDFGLNVEGGRYDT